MLSEAQGIAVSCANVQDSQASRPLLLGLPAIPSRRGPRRRRPVKVRAIEAYFSTEHLAWLRSRGLVPRIARPGTDPGERLGRHRWKIERSIAWLFGYRRPTVHCERKGQPFPCPAGPRPSSHLLQESRETHRMRRPLQQNVVSLGGSWMCFGREV
ncbi:transposase [Streptomyces sp. NPDC047917]|uniref:transposase n=1 Tax=Streptomyces sp. NPDC047917 TaxID=3365491 RepID=UPI0037121ABF